MNSPTLTDCLDSLSHRRNVASLSIFYRYFHSECSSELANCMPHPLAAQDFLLLILILSIYLMQEVTSIFTLSSLSLVNSGNLFLCLFFHLPTILSLSKEECQDTSHTKLNCPPIFLLLLLSSLQGLGTSRIFFYT